jgi:hypothetical protein
MKTVEEMLRAKSLTISHSPMATNTDQQLDLGNIIRKKYLMLGIAGRRHCNRLY